MDYTHLGFYDITHKLIEKEKVLVKMGQVKYETEKDKIKNPFKEERDTYVNNFSM